MEKAETNVKKPVTWWASAMWLLQFLLSEMWWAINDVWVSLRTIATKYGGKVEVSYPCYIDMDRFVYEIKADNFKRHFRRCRDKVYKNLLKWASPWSHPRLGNLNEGQSPSFPAIIHKIFETNSSFHVK